MNWSTFAYRKLNIHKVYLYIGCMEHIPLNLVIKHIIYKNKNKEQKAPLEIAMRMSQSHIK